MVGLPVVFQHTPLREISPPPFVVIELNISAEKAAMFEMFVGFDDATPTWVLNIISLP